MANLTSLLVTGTAVLSFVVLASAKAGSGPKISRQRSNKKAEKILLEYGSGDERHENDDDDLEGSGGRIATMSKCHHEQMLARQQTGQPGQRRYEPQCTATGEFSSKQCNAAIKFCWCVDSNGVQIPDTKRRESEKLNCQKFVQPERKPPQPITVAPRGNKLNQFSVQSTPPPTMRGDNEYSFDTKPKQHESNVEFISNPEMSEGRPIADSVFNRPGILAVIIGGAVIGLLISVTLVMFIVYRMRKKDEGSYALDEPKTSPTIGYTKTGHREFFA